MKMSEKACTFFQMCKEKWRFFHRYANRIMIGDFDHLLFLNRHATMLSSISQGLAYHGIA